MVLPVSNSSADRNDKMANAAKLLEKSDDRQRVFEAMYGGKRRKMVKDLMKITKMSEVRVSQEIKRLFSEDIVERSVTRPYVYEKIDFYNHNKSKILSLARNKEKLKKFPTRTNPQGQSTVFVARYPKRIVNFKHITIDDIDSFSKVKKVKGATIGDRLYESTMKKAFKDILKEGGEFTDWGGETDDLYSTRLTLNGARHPVAFGLKGRATNGNLTPKKLGKNGDQIQRLFKSPADVFLVVYQGQIEESVVYQMQQFAIAKSVTEGNRICFGVIDAQDIARLISAYPKEFA